MSNFANLFTFMEIPAIIHKGIEVDIDTYENNRRRM